MITWFRQGDLYIILYILHRYALMMECWNADGKQRPRFSDVVKSLSHELDQLSEHVIATIGD